MRTKLTCLVFAVLALGCTQVTVEGEHPTGGAAGVVGVGTGATGGGAGSVAATGGVAGAEATGGVAGVPAGGGAAGQAGAAGAAGQPAVDAGPCVDVCSPGACGWQASKCGGGLVQCGGCATGDLCLGTPSTCVSGCYQVEPFIAGNTCANEAGRPNLWACSVAPKPACTKMPTNIGDTAKWCCT